MGTPLSFRHAAHHTPLFEGRCFGTGDIMSGPAPTGPLVINTEALASTPAAQVAALEAGSGWRLRGPGIEHEHRLAVQGLPADFLAQWQANLARFPRGADLVLCCGETLAALPRGTMIEEG